MVFSESEEAALHNKHAQGGFNKQFYILNTISQHIISSSQHFTFQLNEVPIRTYAFDQFSPHFGHSIPLFSYI